MYYVHMATRVPDENLDDYKVIQYVNEGFYREYFKFVYQMVSYGMLDFRCYHLMKNSKWFFF